MKVLLVGLVLVALAAPAFAQTTASPIEGDYAEVYVIAGRVLDSVGLPVAGGILSIELDQEGVKAAPLRAAANCKGDFITSFNLKHVDPKGKAKITLYDASNKEAGTMSVPLDPFYRRSDAVVRYAKEWNNICTKETNVWNVSASVSVRLLNRTEPFQLGDETVYAKPYTGIIRLRYETPGGNTVCPPHPQDQTPGACETFITDARGDIRYTFTLDQDSPPGGRVEVLLQDGSALSVPISTETRLGVKYFEVTGQGAPAELYETPGFGSFALLGLVALVALSKRR